MPSPPKLIFLPATSSPSWNGVSASCDAGNVLSPAHPVSVPAVASVAGRLRGVSAGMSLSQADAVANYKMASAQAPDLKLGIAGGAANTLTVDITVHFRFVVGGFAAGGSYRSFLRLGKKKVFTGAILTVFVKIMRFFVAFCIPSKFTYR